MPARVEGSCAASTTDGSGQQEHMQSYHEDTTNPSKDTPPDLFREMICPIGNVP